MPAHDLALLTQAARAAGQVALSFWRRDPKAWDKADSSPVSEADMACNDLLKQQLLEARPDYGWLSEETPDDRDRLGRARTFIVDPIDGTRAFLAGEDSFAHAIAVAEHGRVTAAVVYLPAKDRLYTATANGPALRDGQPITVSTRSQVAGARVLMTRAGLAPQHWAGGVPDLTLGFRAALAYRLCLMAEGRHDAVITFRDAWEWDTAAATLIAARAGARVTDRLGADLAFNAERPFSAGVVAAPADLHQGLMRHILG